jgi:hypothetical protein
MWQETFQWSSSFQDSLCIIRIVHPFQFRDDDCALHLRRKAGEESMPPSRTSAQHHLYNEYQNLMKRNQMSQRDNYRDREKDVLDEQIDRFNGRG